MRYLLVAASCMIFGILAMPDTQADKVDRYSIDTINFELRMRSQGKRVIHGWTQKNLSRLGDATSIALIKILDQQDFENPQKVKEILPIIRDSFDHPELIASEFDKKPKVTLFLLNQLERSIADSDAQQDIRQTIEFIRARAASQEKQPGSQ